jgi:hypothetical protein
VQVEPIKPTLKAPGIKLLKLKCDVLLSNYAFKFNLRYYIQARLAALAARLEAGAHTPPLDGLK